jgi:hypothetical protein
MEDFSYLCPQIIDNKISLNAKTYKIKEMKQYVIKAYDGEGKLDKRMEVRPRHFEGMEKMKEHILCAGGMLDDDGKMIGSLLVMEFENREQLDEYLAHEPYVVEHVWERIEVERMNVVIFDKEIIRERI